jgi:2-C-methyl-D-erythritol 4-phosphate cytidylyltransferase / 2-C-methyl-D-erythritol 2,4-cyclodiphosphate synthase
MQQDFRVGIGFDSHPLVSGRKLILGGVEVPYATGLSGWSDADVVVHAVIDALCGAADLGDIGTLFPSRDPEFRDISSLILLSRVRELLEDKACMVLNIDVTIIAHSPRLSSYLPDMRRNVGEALGVDSTRVTIKATTTNGLGFVGREEGMVAQAVVLLVRR